MNLVPGQVVYLLPGTGLPSVQAFCGTYSVIGLVETEFAVTAAGRILTGKDADGVVIGLDSRVLGPTEWRLSATAIQLHAALKRGIESAYHGDLVIEET